MALVFTSDEDLNPSWMTNPYRVTSAVQRRWWLWLKAQRDASAHLRDTERKALASLIYMPVHRPGLVLQETAERYFGEGS